MKCYIYLHFIVYINKAENYKQKHKINDIRKCWKQTL